VAALDEKPGMFIDQGQSILTVTAYLRLWQEL
jgi:hypothetical protein